MHRSQGLLTHDVRVRGGQLVDLLDARERACAGLVGMRAHEPLEPDAGRVRELEGILVRRRLDDGAPGRRLGQGRADRTDRREARLVGDEQDAVGAALRVEREALVDDDDVLAGPACLCPAGCGTGSAVGRGAVQHEVDVELGRRAGGRGAELAHRVVAHDGAHPVGDAQVPQVPEELVRLGRQTFQALVAAEWQEDAEPLVVAHRPEAVDLAGTERDAHPVG